MTGGHAVVVGNMEIVQPLPALAIEVIDVLVLDVEWKASRHTPQSLPTALASAMRLLGAVEDIGLEAVERLDGDLHALLLAMVVALPGSLR